MDLHASADSPDLGRDAKQSESTRGAEPVRGCARLEAHSIILDANQQTSREASRVRVRSM